MRNVPGAFSRNLVGTALLVLGTAMLLGANDEPAARSVPASEAGQYPSSPGDSLRELVEQIKALRSQVVELQENQKRDRQEARELRRELCLTKAKVEGTSAEACAADSNAAITAKQSPSTAMEPGPSVVPASPEQQGRTEKLEEDLQLIEAKLNDQYQTKVESGSKYRVRLSGIVLLNLYENRGQVNNQDFPGIAADMSPGASGGAFGGTLRQSQVSLQAFGPDLAGAHTSADVNFDFAGGFPDGANGAVQGLVRLRTATIRMDWGASSLIAGQDRLFFAPLSPSSLATLAQPAFAYAGNLWAWTPQLRVEHRKTVTERSSFTFQAGILDSLTGDVPEPDNYREPSFGEQSGQPAYASRVAWSHQLFGQDLTIGVGGYYGRQFWGFTRRLDGWTGTIDLKLPLGRCFEFTAAYYRGRNVGGFGGAIGQPPLWNGLLSDPATALKPLDSTGGWAQLKYRLRPNFEINTAFGQDNPFAHEMYGFPSHSDQYDALLSRNRSLMLNFIWQPRSDFLFSAEYRWINSTEVGADSYSANHINFSLGYIF